MGRPGGYAGAYNASVTNQFTAGGNAKAGIAPTVGKTWFAHAAIHHGAAGHTATNTIPNWSVYPNPATNQLGGIGRLRSMFVPPSTVEGVNLSYIRMGTNRIRAGPKLWF